MHLIHSKRNVGHFAKNQSMLASKICVEAIGNVFCYQGESLDIDELVER